MGFFSLIPAVRNGRGEGTCLRLHNQLVVGYFHQGNYGETHPIEIPVPLCVQYYRRWGLQEEGFHHNA